MEHQFNAGVRQWLRLEMQLLQRGKFKEADADIHGMRRQRLQQLIGAQHGHPVVQLREALADRL
ncbi:hypothetical protein D3C77_764610 [compost metagenome]